MVLDEVTSALDGKAEAAVLANIAALPGRTVFVAAHRAKAREFATMRLRVDGGAVSAEGKGRRCLLRFSPFDQACNYGLDEGRHSS